MERVGPVDLIERFNTWVLTALSDGFFAALSDLFSTWVLTALSDGIFAALSDLLTLRNTTCLVYKTRCRLLWLRRMGVRFCSEMR